MAVTSFPTGHPAAVKHWSKDVFTESLKQTYALRFMGEGENNLIQVNNSMKSSGDRVTIPLLMQPTAAGISGDNTLEGNEEELVTYTDNVYIDQLRHAVRVGGEMTEQRIPWDVRRRARDMLAQWWSDRIDTACIYQLAGYSTETDTRYTGSQAAIAPSTGRTVLAGDAAAGATASLGTTDIYSYSLIDVCVEVAKLANPEIRPVKISGKSYFVNIIHTTQVTDLRRSTSTGEFLDIQKAILQGGMRPEDSPILNGACGIYNQTIIHDSTRIPSGASNTRRAIFGGAQAACVAFGKGSGPNTFSWKEKFFDYDNQFGVAAGTKWGVKKLQFNSADFGVIVATAYTTTHG